MKKTKRMEDTKNAHSIRKVSEGAINVFSWELNDLQCITLIVLLVAFFFRDILLGNAYFFDDFIYQNYPFRNFAATSMATGQIPLWNPYTFNGMPFLADIQTAVFYPPCLLLTLFVREGYLHFYWLELVIILHLIPAGVSMYFLARSFGLHRIPSLFAGIAFAFSGFMICQMVHQQIISVVAWFPLVLLLFRRAITGEGWHWVFLTGIVLGNSTLGGFPQVSLYLYFFLLLYFLFEFFTTYKGPAVTSRPAIISSLKGACVIAISLAVAMIQLLPTLELAPLSERAEIPYEMSIQGSIAWSQLLTLFAPKFFGTAGGEGYSYWGPGAYWQFWETCIYVGAIPLMMVLISATLWKRSKYIIFFCGLAAFSFLFGLGDNFVVHKFFFDYVPGFSRFRNPARMAVLLSFSASLLSAFAIQHILFEQPPAERLRKYRNLVVALGSAACVLLILTTSGSLSGIFPFFRDLEIFSLVKEEVAISGMVFVVSALTLLGLITRRLQGRWAMVAVLGVFYIDVLLFGGHQNSGKVNPREYFSRTNQLTEFLSKEGKTELFRVNARNKDGMILDRNQGMIDRIFLTEGFTPLRLQRAYAPLRTSDQLYDLLNVKYKTVTDSVNRRLSLVPHPTYLPRAFFLYRMHVVQSEEELLAYLKNPEFDLHTTAVLEKDPGFTLPTFADTPNWRATIISYENTKIMLEVETSHDGLLVLSEIYYPGWVAYVDSTPTKIYQTDYNLRSLFVLKGTHKVEMIFAPHSFANGTKITIATLVLCSLGSIFSLFRTTKKGEG